MMINNIPKDWEVKMLGEVCEILDNMRKPINADEREQRLKKAENRFPYYGATGQVGYIDDYLCDFEAILLGEDGAPFLESMKNKAYIVSGKYWVNNHAHILKTKENIANNKFICHFLNILDYTSYVSGTTRLKLNQSSMKQIKIPLPPIETQKAIVEKLENAFAHIDEAVRHLRAVQTNIPRLKSSLLHCAFSGKLTESQITTPTSTLSFSQRKSNPSPLPLTKETLPFFCTKGEPAHSPLLAKNRAGGTTAPAFSDFSHHEVGAESHYDYHSKALAKESKDNNTHTLPQGWEVKTIGEIGKVVSGGTPSTSNKDNFDGEIAWITPADLSGYKEKYISKGKRNLSEQGLKNSSARLLPPNSILFSSRAPIGYVAIASNALCTNQGFKNLIPNNNVSSEYIYYFLLHSKRLAESVASGTTFKEISATNFSKLPIPLPPLETQNQIVQILESKFAHLEKLAQFVNASLENLQRLKSSLLNQAFKGELV